MNENDIYAANVTQAVAATQRKLAEILATQRSYECNTKNRPDCPERLIIYLILLAFPSPTKGSAQHREMDG
jgi:hypothetical protein